MLRAFACGRQYIVQLGIGRDSSPPLMLSSLACPTVPKAHAFVTTIYDERNGICAEKVDARQVVEIMKLFPKGLFVVSILSAFCVTPATAQEAANISTLAAGTSIGNTNSTGAFTAGANSNINGYVTAAEAVTLGAYCTVTGNVTAGAAFTSGESCTIKGSVSAKAAFTVGAHSIVGGNVTVGADFTSGTGSIVVGDVYVTGAVTLGAGSRILGAVHSGTGVLTYGKGATVGSVK
jgi:serine acetyltransferase